MGAVKPAPDIHRYLYSCLNEVFKINGIGTYKERTLHAVLKNYFEPDVSKQEVRYKGFIADILNDDGVFEVQTRAFNSMRRKLDSFLEDTQVTIIYPAVQIKWLMWIDVNSGEVTKKRKSPKIGTPYVVFDELYKIKWMLTNPLLRFRIVMVDVEEYRKLDGWSENKKKGSTRAERIPVNIGDIIEINTAADYKKLIPPDMPDEFVSSEFKTASGLSQRDAGTALNVLKSVGAVEQIGKRGRAYLYKLKV